MASALSRLVSYGSAHRRRMVWATIWSVLNKLFDLAPPLLIGMAVDTVVKEEDSFLAGFGLVDTMDQLWVLGGLTLLIWGLESVTEYLLKVLWRNLAQTLQHELRLDAYAHVQELDTAWFQDRSTGRLMSIMNDDVNQLERFLDGGANDLIQVATTMVAVTGVFFWFSPSVAVLAMLPIPIIVWGSFRFQKRIAPRYAEVREKASLLNGQLANNLGGIETIKSFVTERAEVERIGGLSNDYREANADAIRLSSAFSPLIRMVIVVGFTATLVYGGYQATTGVLEVGAYSVLVFLTQRLLWPLTQLGATVDLYQRAMASTNRVLDLIDTPVTILSGPEHVAKAEVRGELRFRHLQFSYRQGIPVLQDIDLHIPAGANVAFVGPTGAGKSTVVQLVMRLHDPVAGHIELDGTDIRELSLGDLRRSIGLVSQSVFLFSGSVADNIAYGTPDVTREQVIEAAKLAEAHGFISALPEGYDTLVGERGQKLSGGQRQRISIARAILKDPPVLILDEATSAVDNETEAAIQRSMDKVAVGRTTLVVAHRLSTIRHADMIVVLDQGRVVQTGTHKELLEQGGLYARLWDVQTGARKLA